MRNAIRLAFKTLGGADGFLGSGVYWSKTGEPTRDVASGRTVYAETSYPLKDVAIYGFTQQETDKDPTLSQFQKMVFMDERLPIAAEVDDYFVGKDGRTWEIVQQMNPPGGLVTMLKVRSTK